MHYSKRAIFQTRKCTNLKQEITTKPNLRFSSELHSQIVVRVHFGRKRNLGRLVVPDGEQAQPNEAAETSGEPGQSFVLADGVGDAIDTGLGKRRAVVPGELVVDGEGSVGDDVFADGEAHAGAEAERGRHGTVDDAVSAHDLGRRAAQSSCHVLESERNRSWGFGEFRWTACVFDFGSRWAACIGPTGIDYLSSETDCSCFCLTLHTNSLKKRFLCLEIKCGVNAKYALLVVLILLQFIFS